MRSAMIEFFILRALYRHLADTASDRNRTYQWGWLGVVLWLAGELGGIAIAFSEVGTAVFFMSALLGGALGAAIATAVVYALPDRLPHDFPTATAFR